MSLIEIYLLIISSLNTRNSFIWKHVCSNKHQSCNKINKLHPPFLLQHQCSFACALNNKTTSYKSCSSWSEEKSPLVTVSLTPNNTLNTKTIGGMTCLCFLGPIKRDLTLQAASTLLSYRGYSWEVCKTAMYNVDLVVGWEGFNSLMDFVRQKLVFLHNNPHTIPFDSVACVFNI